MSKHLPHHQLKVIRKRLDITQMRAAQLLGVTYPYFLSIETGQRELSQRLADKIGNTFGVCKIRDRDADPCIVDPKSHKPLDFTKQRYLEYRRSRPSFFLEDVEEVVTPTLDDYARCAHALLTAAEERQQLRSVLFEFFNWFRQSLNDDAMLDSLHGAFDKLFSGKRKTSDALAALTAHYEDEAFEGAQASDKRRKRDRERKKKTKKR